NEPTLHAHWSRRAREGGQRSTRFYSMSAAKRKPRKRDDSSSKGHDASLQLTPSELIRFCKQFGIDLELPPEQRILPGQIKTSDYFTLVRDLCHVGKRSDRDFRTQLRAARNLWMYVHHVAAEVIEEARPPKEFSL